MSQTVIIYVIKDLTYVMMLDIVSTVEKERA
jgi:hypothetical protein